jgi:hypothetical protein
MSDEEHARRVYQAFRNELGAEGEHMSEEELRLEVDAFLKISGMTLADIELSEDYSAARASPGALNRDTDSDTTLLSAISPLCRGDELPSLTKIAKKITGAHWSGLACQRPMRSARAMGRAMGEPEKTPRAARFTPENRRRRAWSRPSTRSTPSAKPAPPSFSRKSTRLDGVAGAL